MLSDCLPGTRSDHLLVQGDRDRALEGLNEALESSTSLKREYKSALYLLPFLKILIYKYGHQKGKCR